MLSATRKHQGSDELMARHTNRHKYVKDLFKLLLIKSLFMKLHTLALYNASVTTRGLGDAKLNKCIISIRALNQDSNV